MAQRSSRRAVVAHPRHAVRLARRPAAGACVLAVGSRCVQPRTGCGWPPASLHRRGGLRVCRGLLPVEWRIRWAAPAARRRNLPGAGIPTPPSAPGAPGMARRADRAARTPSATAGRRLRLPHLPDLCSTDGCAGEGCRDAQPLLPVGTGRRLEPEPARARPPRGGCGIGHRHERDCLRHQPRTEAQG